MPMKNPSHPGDFIWKEIIEPAGLSVTARLTFPGIWRSALRKPLE
jgi:plasmid maintenance system antidote protein VapI